MPANLHITRSGKVYKISSKNNPIAITVEAGDRFQILDEYGNPLKGHTVKNINGDIWIDLPYSAVKPDFILKNYSEYFSAPVAENAAYFGQLPSNLAEVPLLPQPEAYSSPQASLIGGVLLTSAIAAVPLTFSYLDREKDTPLASNGGHSSNNGNSGHKPDTGTGTNPDTGTGTNPDTGTGTNPDTGTGTNPDTGTGTNPDTGTGTNPDTGTGTNPDTGTGTNPDTGTGTNPDTGTGTNPDTGTGTNPDTGTGTNPDTGTGTNPDTGTGTNPDAGTGTNPDTGTGTNPDTGTGTNPDTGTGNNPDTGAGTNPDTGTGTNPDTGTGTNPDTGTGTNPDTGTGNNPDTGTGTNPDTGTGTNPNSGSPSDNGVLNGNKIVLPNAYTHDVLQNGNNQQIAQAARGGVEMNRYQSDAEDAKVIIDDLNNLSKSVRVELSQFVAELLNPIREQWGVGKFAVTEGALRFAQDVANEYENNGKSIWDGKGHYDEGIIRAAAKHGLNDGGNFYENMGGHYTEQPLTLDKLKGMVYDTVVQMLFDDAHSQQGHAKSLLNTLAYAEQNKAIDYLGLDTSLIEGKKLSIHFISAADHPVYIKDRSKFDTTPVSSTAAPRGAARLTLSKLLADPADVWDSLPDTDDTAYSDHAAATPFYPHEPHFEVM